ncbi:Anaphase-promoting complex subunit 4 [Grifola frondosa]|uniref:Anaphase-promoting complex subunit 4 n=1 Tax=Grifola frondosa TaxID=5627 RepID=A0A1C7MRE9_GRIFR|nr:Anaphase-promoting complex subunit 4 [Grifola frondosa]
MAGTSIVSVANVRLPSSSRLLPSSWCPDKDLVLVVSRLGNEEKLSLWKMQGSKKWEIDIQSDTTKIVDIAWGPDGQTIAVAHDPPRVTIHSIQDGRQERSFYISPPSPMLHLTGIWWFRQKKKESQSPIPDIFVRGDDITGSAYSILKGQPLLDPLQDESQPLTATDLFAFQSTHSKPTPQPSLPTVIASWPTLPSDLASASIASVKLGTQHALEEGLDEVDDSNVNSILTISDDRGHIHCFLDGSYPLGDVSLGKKCSITSLYKLNDAFIAHAQASVPDDGQLTALRPFVIRLPHLKGRILRDVARVSSSARDLVWYIMRVVKEMRTAWFGSASQIGARELGPKWVRALEVRQKDKFGQEEPYAMLDLTCLLTTGRASESLGDYLGSGEQMSERGVQKWETTMVESLIKLRDFAEKRVAPACQRLHMLLQEAQGWSQLPQFALCEFKTADINACLELASRAITIASWLAATTRRELVRFRDFMAWLRYETSRAHSSSDYHNPPRPSHDLLEVNDYLMSGLVVSPIDKWFMGPVPRFSPQDLGVPEPSSGVDGVMSAIKRARSVINSAEGMTWQANVKQKDLSHLDRNLDSLIQELGVRCQKIFSEAANATARSAVVVSGSTSAPLQDANAWHPADSGPAPFIRERTVLDGNQPETFMQHLAIQSPHGGEKSYLCLARMQHSLAAGSSFSVSISVLECCIAQEDADAVVPIELLDAEFFDENVLVLAYRVKDQQGPASIATVGYSELIYNTIELGEDVNGLAREALMLEVLQRLKDGQLGSVHVPVIQSHRLTGCSEGKVTLAVNGRAGRRVSCILDDSGLTMEILDMEGEEEEEEEVEEGATAET